MKVQHTMLPLAQLERNEGQIAGLPSNPREWSKAEIEKLKKSIRQTPELLEARGLIVYPHNGKYVILGGNMRYTALSEMKIDNAPCVVLPEGLPLDKLKEIVIKDNGSFGSWGYDALANEWDSLPLTDWGVPAWNANSEPNADSFGCDFSLPDGEKSAYRQMAFSVPNTHAEYINTVISATSYRTEFLNDRQARENENENGAVLFHIVKSFGNSILADLADLADLEAEAEATVKELREYLCDALAKSGKRPADIDKHLGTNGMAGHYFGESQWMFPTLEAYEQMRTIIELPRDYNACRDACTRLEYIKRLKSLKKNE